MRWFPLLILVACREAEHDTSCLRTWFPDADEDGFGDPAGGVETCDPDAGAILDAGDCNDFDSAVKPGVAETCNERDDDCDGQVDEAPSDGTSFYFDADGDGYGDPATGVLACAPPEGSVADASDCDDASSSVNAGRDERCNGWDDDCDGEVDEPDSTDVLEWFADGDGDGFGDPTTATAACAAPDGFIEDDGDCDDEDGEVHPDAAEVCNGVDDDCDGDVDTTAVDRTSWYGDADGDGHGDAGVVVAACEVPAGHVATADDCDDGEATVSPEAVEVCNAVDDDCDLDTDEDDAVDAPTWYRDADGDGYGEGGSGQAACSAPAGHVADGTDCDDSSASVAPAALELCNGVDDDCDLDTDEDDAADAPTWYADADGDGYGDPDAGSPACTSPSGSVANADDCDDTDATSSPAGTEDCETAADEDCDGLVSTCDVWPTGELDADFSDGSADHTAGVYLSGASYVGTSVLSGVDLTGDGTQDLAVLGATSAWVLAGPVSGEQSLAAAGSFASGGIALVSGDLDGDGWDDLVVVDSLSGGMVEGYAGGTASWSAVSPTWTWSVSGVSDFAVGDLEGDGSPSLAGGRYPSTGMLVWHDPASGGSSITIDAGGAVVNVGTADFDGDGLPGLVFGEYTRGLCHVFEVAPTFNTDTAAADHTLTGSVGSQAYAMDADGDGTDDLVAGESEYATLYVVSGGDVVSGDIGTIALATLSGASYTGQAYAVGDLDDDGQQDLVLGPGVRETSYVVLGPLSGTYALESDADTVFRHDTTSTHRDQLSFFDGLVSGGGPGVAIGVAFDDTIGTDAGYVYLFAAEP